MGFWDFAAPALGALVGGGIGSEFGDVGRVVGAGLGGGAGSKLAGNDWGTAALAGGLSAGGAAALPYITNSLGINTTGMNFLDRSFGMPGDVPTPLSGTLNPETFTGGSDTLGGGSAWDSLDDQINPDELSYLTKDLGIGGDNLGITSSYVPSGYQPPQVNMDFLKGADGEYGLPEMGGTLEAAAPNIAPAGFDMVPGVKPQQPGFLDKAWSGIKDQVAANPIGTALAGGGLAYNAIQGMQVSPEEKALRDQAARADAQGQRMQQYLETGTLPPGLQASVDQATQGAKAKIRSDYASRGLSGSTMERDALNNIDMQAKAQAGQIAVQLLNSGAQQTGMSSNIYNYLLRSANQEDQAMAQALAQFGAAMVPQNRKAA